MWLKRDRKSFALDVLQLAEEDSPPGSRELTLGIAALAAASIEMTSWLTCSLEIVCSALPAIFGPTEEAVPRL